MRISKRYENDYSQTISQNLYIYRRDYAGNLGKIKFDDRTDLLA
jgi:hypothetical protein